MNLTKLMKKIMFDQLKLKFKLYQTAHTYLQPNVNITINESE